jgi:hypothetical protein
MKSCHLTHDLPPQGYVPLQLGQVQAPSRREEHVLLGSELSENEKLGKLELPLVPTHQLPTYIPAVHVHLTS